MKTLVFLFLIAMLALPVLAQPGQFATPTNAELDKFPIMNGPLSTKQQAEMKLAPRILKQPVVFQNHFRSLKGKEGRFVLEELPAGTIVLVDTKAKIRYKADCGNRIVEVLPCPNCTETHGGIGGSKTSEVKGVNGASPSGSPGALSRFWDKAKKTWGDSWEAIGALLGFFLPFWLLFALLGLLGYLIYRTFQNRQQGQGGAGQNPPPPAPTQPGAQVRRGTLAPQAPDQFAHLRTPEGLVPEVVRVANPQATPAPGPAAVPPQLFPRRRVIVDLNEDGSERLQCGAQISRVQVDRGEDDGSTIIRISHRL